MDLWPQVFSERLFLRRVSFLPLPARKFPPLDGCLRTSTATFQGLSSHRIHAVQAGSPRIVSK